MRRALVCAAALIWSPAAAATPPAVSIQATPQVGAAPLQVTFIASGDSAVYRWDFGDGDAAEGRVVQHIYSAGAYTATVTATGEDGESARASLAVTAFALTLAAPRVAEYGRRVGFRGRIVPELKGAWITLYRDGVAMTGALTRANDSFRIVTRIHAAGSYRLGFGDVSSQVLPVLVRPVLRAAFAGSPILGGRLRLVARLRPTAAGPLHVRVWRAGRVRLARAYGGRVRLRLDTSRAVSYRVRLTSVPSAGFAGSARTLHTAVVLPRLALGSRGPSVRALERRLAQLRYALRRIDRRYDHDTYEAVLAFQKVYGMARTGRVDAVLWRKLLGARTPLPRVFAVPTHLEIDKARQILLDVRRGRVLRVVHVSTGATGNTPVGRWRVYRKVPGWDWVLWYPMYFLRGFAIHGYPSVPPWPASHGCVRVPMWLAPHLYAEHSHGAIVYVF